MKSNPGSIEMKLLNYLFIALLLIFVSCSSNEKQGEEAKTEGELVELDADFIVDSEDEDLMFDDEPVEEVADNKDIPMEEMQDQVEDNISDIEPKEVAARVSPSIGESGSYTVKKGDTLMWVAFKIYGDYSRWSELSRVNGNIVYIREGQVLNYTAPAEKFMWNPRGNPHTVMNGETLGTISNDKYGTSAKWRSIFDNNRPMIKNPNLIFAGFTLYYIPGRDLASE